MLNRYEGNRTHYYLSLIIPLFNPYNMFVYELN